MIPGYVPPPPAQRMQAGMMGGVQGIQVPPPTPRTPSFVQERPGGDGAAQPQKKASGWRNTVGQISNVLTDAMAGAATPNIAGGGATDIFRAATGAAGARKAREHYEQQQKLAAEQRAQAAEDRKRQIEYNVEKAKREQAVADANVQESKARQAAAERAEAREARTAAAQDRAHKYDHLQVVPGQGILNKETNEMTPFDSDMDKRAKDFAKRYKETGDEFYNPQSEKNKTTIIFGEKGDPNRPKQDTSRSLVEAQLSNDPAERAAAEKIIAGNRAHDIHVAGIRKASEASGAITVADAAAMARAYDQPKDALQAARLATMREASRRRQTIMDNTPPKLRGPELAKVDTWEAEQEPKHVSDYNKTVGEIDATFGKVGGSKKQGIAPIGAPAAGGGFKVRRPDGRVTTFPTKEAADKFKRDAGIP